MKRPSLEILNAVAPPRIVGPTATDDLALSDAPSVRNVAHAEQLDTMRIPGHGGYEATLVAVKKHYDGSNGGEPGHYLLLFVEFRWGGSRWRTPGTKVRAVEANRIARDMMKGKPSKPPPSEPVRVGGKEMPTEESELRAVPVANAGYLLFVRHRLRSGDWARTRGVEVLTLEKGPVFPLLKQLAEA